MLPLQTVERISQFLLELYPNAYRLPPGEFQQDTLVALRPLITFDYAAWGGGVARNRRITDVVMLDQCDRVFSEWSSSIAAFDLYGDQVLRQLGHAVMFDDLPYYRNSVAYNEHWRRYDTAHMLTTSMADPIKGYGSFLSLCKTDARDSFHECERHIKQLLMPHIANALQLNRQAAVKSLARSCESLAIVNPHVGILSSGGDFDGLLRMELGSTVSRRLTALLPAKGEKAAWQGRDIQIRFSPLGDNFLLRARTRHPTERLSPREQQVAELFSGGMSYHEVAKALNVAPSTARTHIAKIYERLGINSKANLIHALSAERMH